MGLSVQQPSGGPAGGTTFTNVLHAANATLSVGDCALFTAAATATLPAAPADGDEVRVGNIAGDAALVTVAPNAGQSIYALAGDDTLADDQVITYRWVNAITKWKRVA